MERLLIVEDEKEIRETLQDILELAGYSVRTAKNGRDGYDEIVKDKPDLVLCDVNMPELSGFELLEAIRQRLRDEIIPPFLFLTAKVERQDIRYGMSLGADDYILKPFDHSNVLQIIRLRLDMRKKLLTANKTAPVETATAPVAPQQSASSNTLDKIALPCEDGLELISFDKIIRCQAERAYCTFHLTDNRKILVSKPMKEFEHALISNNFLKVHKSTIINISYIQKFVRGKNGHLIMTDDSTVPVSVRKREELMQILRPKA